VSYRKDQGRYARMFSFWALSLLVVYGCFHSGGLATLMNGWLGNANDQAFVDPFPLLGSLRPSTCIVLGVVLVTGFAIHMVLNRPRVADALIDTEHEMHKVTWPTWGETWAGTLAVTAMVIVMFLFLTLADLSLTKVMEMLLGGGS
jgi:preprotein translocase SecE subunit